MPTIVAGFAQASSASLAWQDLSEAFPGLNVALQLPPEAAADHDEEGILAGLRSLMVEVVGVQGAAPDAASSGHAATLIVSDVDVLRLEPVKAVLSRHAALVREVAEGVSHDSV